MRYLFTSLVLAVAIGLAPTIAFGEAATPAEAPVKLRAKAVVVTDDIVRLGDLFLNVGERAQVSVAHAPAPGKSAVLDAEWLTETARRHGLAWRPAKRNVRLVLRRASRTIERENIARRIAAVLQDRGLKGKLKVALDLRVELAPLLGRAQHDRAPVCGILDAAGVPLAHQGVHDPAGGALVEVKGGGQPAEAEGAGLDQVAQGVALSHRDVIEADPRAVAELVDPDELAEHLVQLPGVALEAGIRGLAGLVGRFWGDRGRSLHCRQQQHATASLSNPALAPE